MKTLSVQEVPEGTEDIRNRRYEAETEYVVSVKGYARRANEYPILPKKWGNWQEYLCKSTLAFPTLR